MVDSRRFCAETYLNPVYPHSFPDPFVLKFAGQYFGYCTGSANDGLVFGIIRSHDLVNWTEVGGAMTPLEDSPPYYWAPEVTYDNGKFYLYYSVGNEVLMHLRVAVSDRPDGGFVDSGHRLTTEEFAIDAHVFIDDDGSRYMFYATDFLEHTHIGTGTVVDRLLDWFTLEGDPRPVTRAKYDWQVYDPQRKEKGGVRWHTVEGPAVLKRKGLYYEMFSGGNWQNTTYGVSFAITDDLQNENEWLQYSDGERVLPILRTIPDIVVGPGHNSVVRGPNNRELYCIYHRWTDAGRVLAIDRMDFAGDRLFVVGASNSPQPFPFRTSIRERIDDVSASIDLSLNGESTIEVERGSFLLELTWAFPDVADADANFSIALKSAAQAAMLVFDKKRNEIRFSTLDDEQSLEMPAGFLWTAPHLLRLEADHRSVSIQIDDRSLRMRSKLDQPVHGISLVPSGSPTVLHSLELTEGFEELFEDPDLLSNDVWRLEGDGRHQISDGELVLESSNEYRLGRDWLMDAFEIAVNFRILNATSATDGGVGFVFTDESGGEAFRIKLETLSLTINSAGRRFQLPSELDLSQHHQLRLLRIGDDAIAYLDDIRVADLDVKDAALRPALFIERSMTAIEMFRLTAI